MRGQIDFNGAKGNNQVAFNSYQIYSICGAQGIANGKEEKKSSERAGRGLIYTNEQNRLMNEYRIAPGFGCCPWTT